MVDTLRSLAGDTFKTMDVIASFVPPLTPKDLVLESYVFMPHARSGIAAALTTPFGWNVAAQAAVTMRVPVIDDRGGLEAEMTVRVHGPADVTEIDPRQVIRTLPRADVNNAEVDDLAHVEFDRPDLPWLFTPTGVDAAGHLVPWISLVVAERRHISFLDRRGATSRARIRRDQLQPLGDAWAWAHAQVMGTRGAAPETTPTLEQRLGEANAAHNLSRLVCPRRLEANRAYVACVVPTFLVGLQTGLGLTPTTGLLDPAWGTSANFDAGDPLAPVELPVYYTWEFATGDVGNFESLARKVRPEVAPPGVGRRRVDTTRPWPGLELAEDDPGAEMVVEGPVVSPQEPPAGEWPSEAEQHWAPAVADELVDKVNLADRQAHEPNPGPPLVGPPLYGGNHAQQPRLDVSNPEWFAQLNTDPRNRIVAGLGTRVVQMDQEDLVAAAWNQVSGVEAANRALRLAQLAKHVDGSLHRRHLARFNEAAVMAVTERVQPKLHDTPELSVWASLESSSLPLAATTGAFRRMVRVRGRLARVAVRDPTIRAAAIEALTVATDGQTRDWVRVSEGPDAVRRLSATARAMVTDEVAARVAPGIDREVLLGQWDEGLARPFGPDGLTPEMLDRIDVANVVDLRRTVASSLIERLIATLPTVTDIEEDAEAAYAAASHALMVRTLIDASGENAFSLPRAEVKRIELDGEPDRRDETRVVVEAGQLLELMQHLLERARERDPELPFGEFEEQNSALSELVIGGSRIEGGRLREGFAAMGERVVTDDRLVDRPRGRLNTAALQIVAKLNPAITVPARVIGRLTAGSGRMPSWLRPDWFEDGRIEPVMAHPRFAHPMYEPLNRYDRDWMIPGLGLIERADMATLLETNNRFIEAHLVGLNHEMGRELLWREYPTDQRGTYFSSFWTGEPELVADMHEAEWLAGQLGSHVDPALDGQLVFLVRAEVVRRYPGVVAHAARQASVDAEGIPTFEADSPARSLFHILLAPNVLLAGFALTKEHVLTTPTETWWFTLSENPTEPRFGLDEEPVPNETPSRDDLAWVHLGVAPGGFLSAAPQPAIAFDGSAWGESSASIAYLLFQLPARAAFSAVKMIDGSIT